MIQENEGPRSTLLEHGEEEEEERVRVEESKRTVELRPEHPDSNTASVFFIVHASYTIDDRR